MKTTLLAMALLAAPGAAFAQYGGYGGGYGGGGVYVAPPVYQPRYRTVCQWQRVAAGYDDYGRPILRRQRVCQQVAY